MDWYEDSFWIYDVTDVLEDLGVEEIEYPED